MAKRVERQIGRQLDKIFYYGQFCDIGETIKFYKILKVSQGLDFLFHHREAVTAITEEGPGSENEIQKDNIKM